MLKNLLLLLLLVTLVGCTTADKTKKGNVKELGAKERALLEKENARKKKTKRILIWLDTGDFTINETLEELIYLAFEEEATAAKVKYTIISQDVRDAAIEAIKLEHGWKQNDPRFLPQLKKQLSANFFGQIKVVPMFSKGDENEGKLFMLTNKFIRIETALIIVTSSLKYMPAQTKNEYNAIFNKFKQLAHKFFIVTDRKYLGGEFGSSYKLNTPNIEKIEEKTSRVEEKKEEKVEEEIKNVDEINAKTGEKSENVAPGW